MQSLRWMSLQQKDIHLSTLLIVLPVTEYTVMLFIPYCRVASLCCSLAQQYFETPSNVFQSICIVYATLRHFSFFLIKNNNNKTWTFVCVFHYLYNPQDFLCVSYKTHTFLCVSFSVQYAQPFLSVSLHTYLTTQLTALWRFQLCHTQTSHCFIVHTSQLTASCLFLCNRHSCFCLTLLYSV